VNAYVARRLLSMLPVLLIVSIPPCASSCS
jgi:hypothetical protein